jgi:heptosyltransferase-3
MSARGKQGFARILVIKLRLIGDVLLATPVLEALRRAYPNATLDFCASRGSEGILENDPNINAVFAGTPRRDGGIFGKLREEWRLMRRVRSGRYDLVIDLTTSDRSAILTRLSGARMRVGYASHKGFLGRKRAYTETVQAVKGEHMVRKHCRMLQALGIDVPAPRLVFPISAANRQAVEKLLPPGKDYFQVHPISRVARKNWPAAFMAEAVNTIAAKQGWVAVITGSADAQEKAGIAELRALLRCEHLDLSGKVTLKQLGAVSERAKFFLGVDTAPMHIAAAVGAPVVALFGPSSENLWAPWCERALVLSRDLDCRLPCKNKQCETIHCLREMSPAMVLPRIEAFLREN